MKLNNLMGCPCFSFNSQLEAEMLIRTKIENNNGGYSVAINAEKIMMYSKSPEIRDIIDNSILPIPDGSGAALAFRFIHNLKSIRLDLPKTILELANTNHFDVFLLGTTEENNLAAHDKIKSIYPQINIVGRMNGFFKDIEAVKKEIKSSNAQIVMVAMGSPKQEKISKMLNDFLPNVLFIGCGGALDILAGKINRAPLFFQRNHLEWFYRLVKQPKRIRRQKVCQREAPG